MTNLEKFCLELIELMKKYDTEIIIEDGFICIVTHEKHWNDVMYLDNIAGFEDRIEEWKKDAGV